MSCFNHLLFSPLFCVSDKYVRSSAGQLQRRRCPYHRRVALLRARDHEGIYCPLAEWLERNRVFCSEGGTGGFKGLHGGRGEELQGGAATKRGEDVQTDSEWPAAAGGKLRDHSIEGRGQSEGHGEIVRKRSIRKEMQACSDHQGPTSGLQQQTGSNHHKLAQSTEDIEPHTATTKSMAYIKKSRKKRNVQGLHVLIFIQHTGRLTLLSVNLLTCCFVQWLNTCQ